ncbi:hypothetical protein ONS96_012458 [Cadophora gregata f. sp. sojae]|nr:hypothetical protein ONS96_012458 [Cadophora gregata f. sp. sojae]
MHPWRHPRKLQRLSIGCERNSTEVEQISIFEYPHINSLNRVGDCKNGRNSFNNVFDPLILPPTTLCSVNLECVTVHYTLLSTIISPHHPINRLCDSFRDTSQCARSVRRNMGVNIEGGAEEEDFTHEEEDETDGRKGIEGCNLSEQMLGMRASEESTFAVSILCIWCVITVYPVEFWANEIQN